MRSRHILLLWMMISAVGAFAQDAEQATNDPIVPKAGNPHGPMSLDCNICHAESSWEVSHTSSFDHAITGFELEGLHKFALCRDCHREPVFAHIGTQCADCHNDTHRGRLGPACDDCHTPKAWVDQPRMRQDHNATALPLVGAHERVDCDACHAGAVTSDYVGTPTECFACHADDYNAALAPDHLAAGFSIDCERCHGVFSSSWGSGDFIHEQSFPLNGAHRQIDCAACHSSGYTGTPTDCAACHQADYNGTTDPNHQASGFPVSCQECHTTSAWEPSTWDHDALFPINSGDHRTVWDSCTTCHTVPSNYSIYECINCHEHNQTDMDKDHREERDYQYLSTACFECHPRGTH
ncbi:hypothetical protein DRQ50_13830 [bacterium]|nr:MAG: hypothetical protein DRQ50_13830 [bacterium]